MNATEAFGEMAVKFEDNADTVKDVNGVFQFHITGDDAGDWVMNCKDATVKAGTIDDPDTTLECTGEDFVAMYEGELNGMQAFAMGRLKVTGNLPLSLKIQNLLSL